MGAPRVLIDCVSAAVGGGQSWIRGLLAELERDARGLHCVVVCPARRRDEFAFDTLPVAIPERPGPLAALARLAAQELSLPRRVKTSDLYFSPVDFAPPLRCRGLVITAQNLNIFDRRFYATPRLRASLWLAKRSIARADCVVFPSEAAKRAVAARVPIRDERTLVNPYGVAPAAFLPRVPVTPPRVFLPAALERHKNIEVLIRAMDRLRDSPWVVRIAGASLSDPGHARELEALVAAAPAPSGGGRLAQRSSWAAGGLLRGESSRAALPSATCGESRAQRATPLPPPRGQLVKKKKRGGGGGGWSAGQLTPGARGSAPSPLLPAAAIMTAGDAPLPRAPLR